MNQSNIKVLQLRYSKKEIVLNNRLACMTYRFYQKRASVKTTV